MNARTRRTAVYRLYDKHGVLLYVGRSEDPQERLYDHAITKPWWGDVHRKTIEWFDDGEQAAIAEGVAVEAENPVYNETYPAQDGTASYRRRKPLSRKIESTPRAKLLVTSQVRIKDPLWDDFGSALPDLGIPDRSAYVRQCIEYALRRPGSKRPARLTQDQARTLFGDNAE